VSLCRLNGEDTEQMYSISIVVYNLFLDSAIFLYTGKLTVFMK